VLAILALACPALPAQEGKATGSGKKLLDKRYDIEFNELPWPKVMEWLRDETGFPVKGKYPKGTFTFSAPKGRKYTLPEVIDVINGGLLQKNYLVVRLPQSFLIVGASEKINPIHIPLITIKEMKDHGKTELVRINYTVKGRIAEDVADGIRGMMGVFGEVHPLTGSRLVMQGTVENLMVIIDHLCKMTESAP
jgi:hypothetical protein